MYCSYDTTYALSEKYSTILLPCAMHLHLSCSGHALQVNYGKVKPIAPGSSCQFGLSSFHGGADPVISIGLSSDVVLYDAESGTKLKVLKGHYGTVHSCVFHPFHLVCACLCLCLEIPCSSSLTYVHTALHLCFHVLGVSYTFPVYLYLSWIVGMYLVDQYFLFSTVVSLHLL